MFICVWERVCLCFCTTSPFYWLQPSLLKLRITDDCVPVGVRGFVCEHAILCVSTSTGACRGAQAWSGVLLLHLGLCGCLWSGVDLVGLSSGAQTKPVQDYPPRDKVCDYHEKTASSSPIAKDCQACWRGGPPLISCREMLNAGTHSPPYTHTHGNTMTRTHVVICLLILIHICKHSQVYKNYTLLLTFHILCKPFLQYCLSLYLYDECKRLEHFGLNQAFL